jgi:16S rRNA (cytosine1402-N4)-methyltransferase
MHVPVLKKEVLEMLNPKPGENFVDATAGFLGHTTAILERGARVLSIEWDEKVYSQLKTQDRLILVNNSYVNLKKIVEESNFRPVNGILFDLGMSSWDIDDSGRGFSFLKDEPLDMRYDVKQELTAEHIVNNYLSKDIEVILKEYGEERFAKRIAGRISQERENEPIKTTFQLVNIIRRSFPRSYKFGKQHVAARTFQALRIAVNDELNNLRRGLYDAVEVLASGGRIGVISFHSLEDRIVKNFFRESLVLQILTKKPIIPSKEEVENNYRSHSAKFRGAVKK